MPDLSRRHFLKSSALAGAALTFGEMDLRPARADGPKGAAPSPAWADRPMRWSQLTLVENDPGRFSPKFWLEYFKRIRSDAVCLSAGGCVAYYPTTVPYHHRSAWLGDSDVFGELVAGCRELGMVVVARTDPHATYEDAKTAHPDWIAVTADGQPRRHWASPEMWVTCGLGPYNFDFMTDVTKEIAARYPVDGIFVNRWDGSGMCYCEHCRANFKAATGHDLPRTSDPRDPVRRSFETWREERLFSLWGRWDGAVRQINPDSCVVPNTGGGASFPLDMVRVGELAPSLIADRQARHGLMPPWANGKSGKEFRATLGRKPVISCFSIGLEEAYRWKDSVQSPAEIRLWVADGVANGTRPWFTKFGGTINDPRWLEPVAEIYNWCAAAEPYLRNERPLARVAIVYSQQTARYAGGRRGGAESSEDAALGWYQALIEARIPFEMVHEGRLDAEHLAPFQTLILPDLVALSDAQCDQLRAFVARGGGLIATSETSLQNERGELRRDFGLGDLFGARWGGRTEGPMHNAYLQLEHAAFPDHPLLAGLADAPRIIHGVWRVEVAATGPSAASPVTLIRSYPDLPMEKVYARQAPSHVPQVFLRELPGGGRVAYFPWDIDRTYWEILGVDHGQLLRNAVAWATHEPVPVAVTGPGLVEVTYWQQRHSLTVHLVNLTNPMMMKGPLREVLALGEQRLRVRLPDGLQARRVRLLVGGGAAAFQQAGPWVTLAVPSISVHEVVGIDV